MKQPYREETPKPVEHERALAHAQLTVRRDWAAGNHGFEHWHKAEFDSKPLVIHDLNGAELFYDFPLNQGNATVGWVRTSASQVLGSPVIAVEMGPRSWDPDRALRAAMEKAQREYPRTDITATELVCYSYPKIGIRVDLGGDVGRSVIYDVGNLSEVKRFGPDQPEGFTSWSFYQRIAHRQDEKLRQWELADRELEFVRDRTPDVLSTAFTDRDVARMKAELMIESPYLYIPLYSSRVLKYGPRCRPHDCFMLYAQQTDVYCACATAQMILDFHRWPYSQDEIAEAMNTDEDGTENIYQLAGYESLTNDSFNSVWDPTADWAEAKAEIDDNRPLKSGITGHARACAGWKRQNVFFNVRPPQRWLQIYDPWPWNENLCLGGAVVWEAWDAVVHTNFIFVRHA